MLLGIQVLLQKKVGSEQSPEIPAVAVLCAMVGGPQSLASVYPTATEKPQGIKRVSCPFLGLLPPLVILYIPPGKPPSLSGLAQDRYPIGHWPSSSHCLNFLPNKPPLAAIRPEGRSDASTRGPGS